MIQVTIQEVKDSQCLIPVFCGSHEIYMECIGIPYMTIANCLTSSDLYRIEVKFGHQEQTLSFRSTDLDKHDRQLIRVLASDRTEVSLGLFLTILKRHDIELKPKPRFKVKPLEWVKEIRGHHCGTWKSKTI